ncbi:rhomboid family intramembrane serine protease [Paenibacillus sp. GCM10012307]|uniref:Rhomboid family intramembrane serine protease n=1 Tax=Paenibacillus roseus TaxID=2798579 RepID=A0A934MNX1_9BACL|nr:rhomboid family intramembrane serine protease [Paenibacillus roseus]MBJ6359844.1 rhomboid family intramembrane serine protease [Paenibacillus roseus]
MIFLRYESFRSYLRLYPVTSTLLALNVLVFMLNYLGNGNLINFGAFVAFPGDPYGLQEPWRYVTSIVLHYGWEHLFFNSFSTLVFAPPLERLLGSFRYTIFYVLCGIVGNILSALMFNMISSDPALVTVGASGAIYGIFGAYLNLAILQKSSLDEASRKTVFMILGFGLIYSFLVSNINIWAHVGGLIAGFLLYSQFARKNK